PTHGVPRQNQSAESLPSVSETTFAAFLPDAAADVPLFVSDVTRRINENGDQLRVVIGIAMEQQQARLAGHSDADFVGDGESAGALEDFLRQEYLHVAEQLILILRRQPVEDRKIVLEDCAPRLRWWLGAESRPTAGFEEVEDHTLKIRSGVGSGAMNFVSWRH